MSPKHTNRLANEKSPYLLQHAHNPVDWYPWGQEAFDKAKAEDKLIFLSVGYSTCHWCHVMERESFEDEAIAKIMNENFVCVKVDREERPDVDKVYMTFVQATTGGGGWPMNVWMTPDLKPVVGGTYFPPTEKFGQPGFPAVLNQIAGAWKTNRESLAERGEQIITALRQHLKSNTEGDQKLSGETMLNAYRKLAENYDKQLGGFGQSPKFPRPVTLNFLQRFSIDRHGTPTEREQAKKMALFTLDKMAAGGMYDHLGGGFHRYSVDQFWHVPHFEKMLYDQSQLVIAYLEALQISGDANYERVARDILNYVLRDMTDESGGFYSAEDADSFFEHGKPEHGEGAFYVWTEEEIDQLLTPESAKRFKRYYGVKSSGNAPAGSDPHQEFTGKNILIQRLTLEEGAKEFNLSPAALEDDLRKSRKILFSQREKRPRPHLDDKIITSWNGLMISAFAKAAQVLDAPEYRDAAQRAATFIKENLYIESSQTLRRNYREGVSDIEGFADDYAYLIQGLLDLYEASFDTQWIEWADTLQQTQTKLFYDTDSAGFFSATGKDSSILLRLKEEYDGAEPSPNSISIQNLLRLAQLTDNETYDQQARQSLQHFAEPLNTQPTASPQLLAALNTSLAKPKQIVFAAKPDAADLKPLLRELHQRFIPNKLVLLADSGPGQAYLSQRLSFIETTAPIDGKATAFVCENFVCQLPTTDINQFKNLIAPPSTKE